MSRQLPPPEFLSSMRAAVEANALITIEVVQQGKPLYLRDSSIFGEAPVENPADARNYADDASNDFRELWYHLNTLYVKDVGGGKSSIRTDVPGRVAIFEKPAAPKPLARISLGDSRAARMSRDAAVALAKKGATPELTALIDAGLCEFMITAIIEAYDAGVAAGSK